MHNRVNRIPSTRLRATRHGPLLTPQLAATRAHRSAARAIIIIIKRRKLRSSPLLPSLSPTDSHHPLNAMIVERHDSSSFASYRRIFFLIFVNSMEERDTRNIISKSLFFENDHESKFGCLICTNRVT